MDNYFERYEDMRREYSCCALCKYFFEDCEKKVCICTKSNKEIEWDPSYNQCESWK